MNAETPAAIWAAAIAACATLAGYLFNQSRIRRERRATAFADAMAAMRDYEDFPFSVWRRTNCDDATRARLDTRRSKNGRAVRRHRVWLRIEAPVVGEAYEQLWRAVRQAYSTNLSLAWAAPPRTCDQLMIGEPPDFVRAPGLEETELCIRAMRNELSLLPMLRRPHLRELLSEHARHRSATADPPPP
jgi:hypothetical protein